MNRMITLLTQYTTPCRVVRLMRIWVLVTWGLLGWTSWNSDEPMFSISTNIMNMLAYLVLHHQSSSRRTPATRTKSKIITPPSSCKRSSSLSPLNVHIPISALRYRYQSYRGSWNGLPGNPALWRPKEFLEPGNGGSARDEVAGRIDEGAITFLIVDSLTALAAPSINVNSSFLIFLLR